MTSQRAERRFRRLNCLRMDAGAQITIIPGNHE